jgi:hypothetical protein
VEGVGAKLEIAQPSKYPTIPSQLKLRKELRIAQALKDPTFANRLGEVNEHCPSIINRDGNAQLAERGHVFDSREFILHRG